MEISLVLAARSVEILCGISLLIQSIEFLNIREALGPRGVWAYSIGRDDLAHASGPVQSLFAFLAREDVWLIHLVLRVLAALVLVLDGASLPLVGFLFAGTLVILIRWRGAFNGGSDFMTIVVLSGLLIAMVVGASGDLALGWRAGLIYIAIHAASSYFISGGIKLLNPEWRSGEALALFLDGGIYGPLSRLSLFWLRPVAMVCSWAFILWECLVPLAFLDVEFAVVYCAIAGVFHCLVFWYFGLNRFVFAWLAGFPAIIYVAGQLN
jgi:hypothetical protein